ncbi:TPA: 3-phosphoglycerate dehydrogenase [Legionella pneumophila]|nr:NAD(P)-dependent oxidoreductase [Legionella pneumophila]HAT1847321.1 3-phosphoglycerate dehydrogenase [Legionella pneumophila]HAT1862637.1 3-phosphoglycerate dehydrogenase [Legionella pneumophila]HAT3977310.1 3-phosphoglycerate dehydrogenase [Legionella pneumophila]HAT8357960.1 3-phosphoglycerate dehydrogenase [Legionella pneumophila]HAU1208262.1 3-phosphoglycerate dehydrogenase [Legionella pneumophila]
MKIAVIEPIGIAIQEIRSELPDHTIIECDSRQWTDEQLMDFVKDVDVIALTNRRLSAAVINSALRLQLIAVAFAGVDHIDRDAANKRNIPVKNAAGYANTAVSELVFGLMISLARHIPDNNQKIREQGITKTGVELKNKVLGIVGYGAIGAEVARLANSFQMTTLIYDRKSQVTLDDLFSQSDFVTLHVPLTNETKGMVNLRLLSQMKKSAYLINCARGPIVVGSDLKKALEQGMIAGAALDVFDVEPPLPANYSLWEAPNLIATPHIGFNTREALVVKGQLTIKNIKEFLLSRL